LLDILIIPFSQEKLYAVDFFKMQNALMMREIFQLRSALMKRNAALFDWFVQHIGSSQIALIHKDASP